MKTFPRNYPTDHKRIEDLRLQAYYVTRTYSKRELYSADFKDMVTESWRQSLRLCELLFATWMDPSFDAPIVAASNDEPDEPEILELWDDRL